LSLPPPPSPGGKVADVQPEPTERKTVTTTPKIYVACLAAYNNGKLHGAWIDADQSADAIHEEIKAMLASSPEAGAEEWAIHDYEGFGAVRISEWESMEMIAAMSALISEHGELGVAALAHFCGDIQEARSALEENYCGQYRSLADFAQEITEETTSIPQNLAYYIDYSAMARDMEMNGDVFTIETGFEAVHVFWNH
jgi:antirestriction protein